MAYRNFVADHMEALEKSGYLKTAFDLAELLDGPVFTVEQKHFDQEEEVRNRESLYDLLCAICVLKGDGVLPPYDKVFYEGRLKTEKAPDADAIKKSDSVRSAVYKSLRGVRGKDATLCRAIAKTFAQFPGYDGSFGSQIHPNQLIALINRGLDKAGVEVLRPDYSKIKLPSALHFDAPARPVKLLIVDDLKKEACVSVRPLVGWPDVNFDFYIHQYEFRGSKDYQAPAAEIISRKPDIVLMDQGLGNLEGDELLAEIRKSAGNKILFVANTGGTPDKLYKAGALENYQKGAEIGNLRRAMMRIKY